MITAYITPMDWIPNPGLVNEPPDYQYLAYRLSADPVRNLAIWSIHPVVDVPTAAIEDLLVGVDYQVVDITGDLNQFGFKRQLYPTKTIIELEDIIDADVAYVTNELL